MGLAGPGFVAPHHLDAVRRLGNVEIIGIAGSSLERTARKATELGVDRAYGTYEELVADPAVHVVHNTTPNHLHFPVSMAAIAAGKHIVSDKALAISSSECLQLAAAAERAGVVNAATFNHRGYALIQRMRAMIAEQSLGYLAFIHGHNLQDGRTSDRVYSWRMDPALGGPSSAIAESGSHWCDLAQHVTGSSIAEVYADPTTVVRFGGAARGSAGTDDSADVRRRHVRRLVAVRCSRREVHTSHRPQLARDLERCRRVRRGRACAVFRKIPKRRELRKSRRQPCARGAAALSARVQTSNTLLDLRVAPELREHRFKAQMVEDRCKQIQFIFVSVKPCSHCVRAECAPSSHTSLLSRNGECDLALQPIKEVT